MKNTILISLVERLAKRSKLPGMLIPILDNPLDFEIYYYQNPIYLHHEYIYFVHKDELRYDPTFFCFENSFYTLMMFNYKTFAETKLRYPERKIIPIDNCLPQIKELINFI